MTCIIIIAMLITRRFITNLRRNKEERWKGQRPPPRIRKLSQRSVYLTFFLPLPRPLLSLYSITITTDKSAYMVLLFTSRFIVYLLFNKTAQRREVIHLIAPFTNLPFASHVFFIIGTPYNI